MDLTSSPSVGKEKKFFGKGCSKEGSDRSFKKKIFRRKSNETESNRKRMDYANGLLRTNLIGKHIDQLRSL